MGRSETSIQPRTRASALLSATFVVLGLLGCAHTVETPSLRIAPTLSPSDSLRLTSLALIDTIILPQENAGAKKVRALMYSNERFTSDGDSWVFIPNEQIMHPTDLLLMGLRSAGFSIRSYSTLHQAKHSGAQFALIPAQKRSLVRFPDSFWSSGLRVDVVATVELEVALVNLDTFEVIWKDSVLRQVRDRGELLAILYDYPYFVLSISTGAIEQQVHPFRVFVARAYYDAATALVPMLEQALGTGQSVPSLTSISDVTLRAAP